MKAVLARLARAGRAAGAGPLVAVARDTSDRAFLRAHVPPLRADVDGIVLRGYLRHRSFLAEAERGGDEDVERRLFVQAIEPGTTVVDGGAHVGLQTLLAARAAGSTGNVVAFEPDPYNLAALTRNVAAASAGNVRIVPKALSDRARRAEFRPSGSTTGGSLAARTDIPTLPPISVETTTVDEQLDGLPLDRLVVKLDLEGAEPAGLAGARASLTRAATAFVFLEINPRALAEAGSSPADVTRPLRELGFRLRFSDAADQRLREVDDAELTKGNLYCTREA